MMGVFLCNPVRVRSLIEPAIYLVSQCTVIFVAIERQILTTMRGYNCHAAQACFATTIVSLEQSFPGTTFFVITGFKFSGKTVFPFTTYAVSGLGNTVRDYTASCPGATIGEGLAVRGEEVRDAGAGVESWLDVSTCSKRAAPSMFFDGCPHSAGDTV